MVNNEGEDILGRYSWYFVPLSELDLFVDGNDIGQYGKFRMAVEEIVDITYDNGRLRILNTR